MAPPVDEELEELDEEVDDVEDEDELDGFASEEAGLLSEAFSELEESRPTTRSRNGSRCGRSRIP